MNKNNKTRLLKKFLASYAANRTQRNPHVFFFSTFTILDVIYLISEIWCSVSINTLQRAWHNLNINTEIESEPEVVVALPRQSVIPMIEINSWLNEDDSDPGWQRLRNDEIVAQVRNDEQSEEEVIEEEPMEEDVHEPIFTTNQALESIKGLRKWFENQQLDNKAARFVWLSQLITDVEEKQFSDYNVQSTITF